MPPKIEELERRVKFNPDPKNYFILAEAYRDELNFEKALEACKKGLEKQPESIGGQVLLGEILFKLGRFDEALNLVNNILSRAPENTKAYNLLYEICMQKKDFQGAKSALEKLFFFNPFDEEISQKLLEINRILEKSLKKEIPLPEEELILERGSAELKEERWVPSLPEEKTFEETEEEFATKRIDLEDVATMAREIKEKVEEEEAFITPTMAEIYLKQGLVDKAIETYYKLYEMKKEEAFLKRAKELEEKLSKSTYYATYANLLEKLLERIAEIKREKGKV